LLWRESEYITLCNDDVEFVHKDWFPNVKEYFEKRPEILGINPASIKAFTPDRTKDWMPYKKNIQKMILNICLNRKQVLIANSHIIRLGFLKAL